MSASIALTALLGLLGRGARADSPVVVTLVPEHVYLARGFSIREGDYFSIEPAFLFLAGARVGHKPIVGVARPMAGVGGSGVGVGIAFDPFWRADRGGPLATEDYVSILPISLEAHLERTYEPTHWRAATYLGPQLSLSIYLLKASVGLMVDADDRRNRHAQLGIGCGF